MTDEETVRLAELLAELSMVNIYEIEPEKWRGRAAEVRQLLGLEAS